LEYLTGEFITEITKTKLAISLVLVVAMMILAPAMGFTSSEKDARQGVVIDFGYWDTVWIEMTFTDGMDGYTALEEACHINGYDLVYRDEAKTIVYSVDEQVNLSGMEWKMYLISSGKWEAVEDPSTVVADEHDILCWARAAGPDSMIPGTDATGFTYYSYAVDGFSYRTGEKLKVVSLAPSVTETIASVGGIDLIVGTDLYSDYPQEILDGRRNGSISVIGGYIDPNYEWIIKLAPDLVFCEGGTGEHVSMADRLRKSGIDCVVLYDSVSIETLYDNIWITAAALGLSDNANSAINAARGTMDILRGVIGIQATKRVFVSLSADPSPWTSGADTFMSDIISNLSARNVFDNNTSWFMVSKEQIHLKQPEFIIIIYEGSVTSFEDYNKIIDRIDPVWRETPAYRNGEIYIFSGDSADILSRPGPRLSEAAELIAKILHPDPFLQKDPMDLVPKFFGDDYRAYLKYQRVRA